MFESPKSGTSDRIPWGASPWLWLILLAHCVYWLTAFPNSDEAYYWLWGQRLDWSYYDHPPLHAWIQGLFSHLGHSRAVLRLPTLVSGGLFFGTYYRLARYLYGQRARQAWYVIFVCCWSSPLYFIFLTLAWQDQWLLAFSLLSLYGFIRFCEGYRQGEGATLSLYGAALALGLAGLCKYTAVFVALTMAATLLMTPYLRPLFRERRLYGATAIALLCQAPVLWWNVQNDWLSVQYYLSRSVDSGGGGLQPLGVLFFWLTSALILSPLLVPPLAAALGQPWTQNQVPDLYRTAALGLFWISTGSLSLVGLFSTALYYWNILAYILLLALVPTVFLPEENPARWRRPRLFRNIQILGAVVAWLLVINYCIFPLAALAGEEGDPDGRMLFGWEKVATAVTTYQSLPQYRQHRLITTDYRSAAALAYALDNPEVLAVSPRLDQFDVWLDIPSAAPVLVLADDWYPLATTAAPQLAQTQQLRAIPIQRFGQTIKTYYLYSGLFCPGERSAELGAATLPDLETGPGRCPKSSGDRP